MNTWHRCLIPILGEDPVQCVGDFLPFEYLFAWQYPNLSPAMKTRKSLLDSDEYANFMYAIIPYEKYAPERKFVYKNYVQALEEGSMAHLEIYRTQYFFLCEGQISLRALPDESILWLSKHKMLSRGWYIIRDMLHDPSRERYIPLLYLFKDEKIPIEYFLWSHMDVYEGLLWFFQHPELLYISAQTMINLDEIRESHLTLWITVSPVPKHMFKYEYIVDYARTVELLETLFHNLLNFHYTDAAIFLAIEENNIEVLEWWAQKEAEEALVLELPTTLPHGWWEQTNIREWVREHIHDALEIDPTILAT